MLPSQQTQNDPNIKNDPTQNPFSENAMTAMPRLLSLRLLGSAAALVLLAACANEQTLPPSAIKAAPAAALAPEDEDADYGATEAYDPIESVNRAIFQFNYVVDRAILRPTVQAYRYVVPEVVRTGVHNVLDNWFSPVSFFNSLFQGKFERAGQTFWRFVINTSMGFLGFADVAGEAGLRAPEEDLGQTLGSYGVGSGPYLILPILGPTTLRDGVGRLGDIYTDPSTYFMTERDLWWRAGSRGFDVRNENEELLYDTIYKSVDPYATMRSLYTQRRAAEVAE